MRMPLFLRFAFRELRGGLRGFRILIACLSLGVAAIAGVGSLERSIVQGLASNGRAILGGDIEFRLTHRTATAEELSFLTDGGKLSVTASLRAMAINDANNTRTLIELKAVDAAYPLYGKVDLAQGATLDGALGERGAAVDQTLAQRLGLTQGSRLRIGETEFIVRAIIEKEPDQVADGLVLGPRVLIAATDLTETGLIQPGSLVRWSYRIKTSPDRLAADWRRLALARFPDAGWQIRDPSNANPALTQWLDRIGSYLSLVGLTALVVGGVGVANAVRGHLEGKITAIATLKSLGAEGRTVFAIYATEVLLLSAFGTVVGIGIGACVPVLLLPFLQGMLPIGSDNLIHPLPLALAAAYGFLTAITFSFWPIGRAREIMPAGLFRNAASREQKRPRPHYLLAIAVAALGLAALAIARAQDPIVAAWFLAGALGCFGLLFAAARLVSALARRAPRTGSPALRLAVAALHRPGSATASILMSLGLGLTVLTALAEIEANMSRNLTERLPENAPAFFFVDIQPDQLAAFVDTIRQIPGAGQLRAVPNLRGRIMTINGVPADQATVGADSRWALRGDRGLTYAADPPAGSSVVAGTWWRADYAGPPLVSLDARIASDMGLKVGDRLGINVLGRNVEATIANLRRIDWTSLGINYALIFAPGFLERAPHTYIATVNAEDAAEGAVFRSVTDRFSNVTVVRVRETIDSLNAVLKQIGLAIRSAGGVAIVAGILVLIGAIGADQNRRRMEAAILKAVGATRADIVGAHLAEYALMGAIAGIVAAALGALASWVVLSFVLKLEWSLDVTALVATILGGSGATLAVGAFSTWRSLSARTAALLRGD